MYFTYIIECSDSTLYTGYTTDITYRIKKHNEGKAAKYTKFRVPVKLKYHEKFSTKSEAMKRERAIKKMSRQEKLNLIYKKQSNTLNLKSK
ncbi:GIY-YIG nuclease family protein [Natranaerobius thermophilus]|uniref:Excinuclease ABC C subunit domain protein n=1 Tax=Natranaerobius thermophilus (strain ATCC BAA-1301 / DSM 18059 / JW/NM-WN-LF) TaxID=457570 RepID=B2A134_NATTJ|nr:GIY-YIG nuclease family protein [Natranaerobius thermophilus]ACB84657.1 Excinuclease ABC C subunit domain protein [Natranaerobius thermophilus JW/NM-WN-LF]